MGLRGDLQQKRAGFGETGITKARSEVVRRAVDSNRWAIEFDWELTDGGCLGLCVCLCVCVRLVLLTRVELKEAFSLMINSGPFSPFEPALPLSPLSPGKPGCPGRPVSPEMGNIDVDKCWYRPGCPLKSVPTNVI